jgi:hypothetical protein
VVGHIIIHRRGIFRVPRRAVPPARGNALQMAWNLQINVTVNGIDSR